MKINCIAIDDEPLALKKMKNYISKISYMNLLTTFDNGIDAISYIKNNKIDLMFLDIQMDDFTGIQLLEALKNKPLVILTTAYDAYALKGYELNVCDYLLKPISFERFLQAVDKAFDLLNKNREMIKIIPKNMPKQKKDDYMFVKTEYRMQKVNFKDILYIQGMKDYLIIRTPVSKIWTLLNFKKMEEMLPADDFMRVHKSYIIPIDKIDSIERSHIRINDESIPIGESYRKAFFEFLDKKNVAR